MKADRDASMDKLLASTLKASRPETPGEAHLDAETLAAWADGALNASERASAEAHAAGCTRCQQLLAAMVRALPTQEVTKSRWRMPSLAWLVPLTAAATALVIWVAVPKPTPVQVSTGTAVDEASPAAAGPPVLAPPDDTRATERAEAARRSQESRLEARAPQRSVRVIPESAPTDRDRADTITLEHAKQESVQAKAAPPPVLAESAGNIARGAAAPSEAAAAPPPAAPIAIQGARLPAAAARMATGTGLDVIVVSSNPSTRFRLLPGGSVQRSADAGSTWRTEVTGTNQTLKAGSSPSPSVCWLVGGAGTVLLSVDGRTWRRIGFPESVDLLSVTATDQDNAFVGTADGRVFVTADGGQTWTLRPGP
jgi:hypothetical protein